MKKIIIIVFAVILSLTSAIAQDSRGRNAETVVSDVLAAMPAQDAAVLNGNMADLARSAPKTIEILAGMLVPASQGKNNLVEYAISGVAAYVSDPLNETYKPAVLSGLKTAAEKCEDTYNKQFLNWQVALLEPQAPKLPEAPVTKADLKAAKTALKSGNSGQMCSAARTIIENGTSADAVKFLGTALGNVDRPFRNAVLGYVTEKAGVPQVANLLVKKFPKLTAGAKIDVINWLGNNKISNALNLIIPETEKSGELGSAAVSAIGKIGGDKALSTLITLLSKGGERGSDALAALKSFMGNVASAALEALKGDRYNTGLLQLCSDKHVTGATRNIFDLASSRDVDTRATGARLLSGVVGEGDVDRITSLMDAADAVGADQLQPALFAAMKNLDAKGKYSAISKLLPSMKNPSRLFPALASSGTDEAVADLQKAFDGGSKEALSALATMDNVKVAPVLLNAFKADPEGNASLLTRYVELVNGSNASLDQKRNSLAAALALAGTTGQKTGILKALAAIPTMKSFLLAGKYMDDPDKTVRYSAATAVKDIVSKTEDEIDYGTLKSSVAKAQDIFRSTGDPDDGYAVDQLSNILSKAAPSPVSQLTAEEKAQGFEMLFDGTDLSNWQGNLEGYIPLNGTIYVTSNYGSTGNLYTKKKYKDFIYRFEFCFLREGVNNGVGVRTPMNVDAAYDGMCEVQILDHDAPMYANLAEYQVHGSVYGVIPAKRIKHKPLGEWATEEIVVKGNHIKVTVNGEVIVDGDIRKACKGHNVAPDGSAVNPYTVDHRNHPGMFNKDGYISFCGHGEGLKIRNVRVLDLNK